MVVHNESWTDGFFNWCKVVINLAVYSYMYNSYNSYNSNQWSKATMKQQQPTWQVSTSFYCVYLLFDTRSVVLQPNCCITDDLLFYNPSVVLHYSRLVVLTIDFMFYNPSVVLHYSRFVVLHYSRFVVLQPICCFTTYLLFYSRFVVRGTLWVSEETEKMSHGFYQSAALDIGENLR